jgi:hypothetical protein
MVPIDPSVFANQDVRLRVWFDDDTHGSQLLSPDQRITAVGYAMVAQSVADGAVTSEKIAAGAIGSAQLAAGAVQAGNIAPGAVGNGQLASATVTVTAGNGLAGGGAVMLGGAITLTNAGVTGVAAGEGITLSGTTGSITIGTNASTQNTPGTLVMRDTNGNFSAGTITGSLAGNATMATATLAASTAASALTALTAGTANDFLGTLAGDVTGTQGATSVASVGGVGAADLAAGALIANTATALNAPASVVLRDANGNFSAGTITGSLAGNAATATTAVSFSGPLSGDVTGTQGAVVVVKIGGVPPDSASTPGSVVLRDGAGGFSAGTITADLFQGSGAALSGVPGTLPWETIAATAQLAEANKGYLAVDATLVTITLPAAAGDGDIVRVTGVGAGGWAIVPAAGQGIVGFVAGLGPVGSQGAGGAVQYVGGGQWQPVNESQLAAGSVTSAKIAAGAVGSAQLAAGAVTTTSLAPGSVDVTKLAAGAVQNATIADGSVTNAKLATPTYGITAGAGLAGGGSAALGGTLTLSVPNGGIGNAQLANPSITVNTGGGLTGGGAVPLGGSLSLSIPLGGITSALLAPGAVEGASISTGAVNGTHLAPGAAMANITNSGQDLAAIAALVSNPGAAQWLGASAIPTFMGVTSVNTGTGSDKPGLVLDRGVTPKGRVTFQRSGIDSGWSGLVLSVNADWNDETGYAYDDDERSQSIFQLEYEWLAPGGFRQNELNWTSSGRRIWAHYCRTDDSTKAGVAFLAPTAIIVPETDTTGTAPFRVEGYGDVVEFVLQNDSQATPAAAAQVTLRGYGSASSGPPTTEWYIATDRWLNGTNNFYIGQGLAGGRDRLFIDETGKVGINNATPQTQLDVTGTVHASGSVQAGGIVDAAGFTVNGAPLQTIQRSLAYSGGQVQAMGNSVGSGYAWRSTSVLVGAFSPFGGSSEDRGPFVPQLKADNSFGCISLPRTWANGIQIKVRTWYCLKPGDTAAAAPNNAVVLQQGIWARSTPQNSVSQPATDWDISAPGGGPQQISFAGGIDGELIFDERTYTIPIGADLNTRQIRFGRFGPDANDTEPKDIYFVGITVEQL